MSSRSLMIQGTGSDVGKSLIVAGLCRLFANQGIRVAPFKPQNMSNNAAVAEGGEIGRAQFLQARAAKIPASVRMNPVLLKPQSDRMSQVIVRGKVSATLSAKEYYAYRAKLLPAVLESYHHLARAHELVLVEGAGSASEINLRAHDIANMGFAEAAGCPVVLVGDIERGGVIASLVGTHTVIAEAERARIRGFIINRFRGEPSLFDEGMRAIERFTGWPAIGLVPHFEALSRLPQEDSLALSRVQKRGGEGVHIVVFMCPHIANFDDLDPLAGESNVRLTWLRGGEAIPADAALAILPGSKATMADLAYLRAQGWEEELRAHALRGGMVLGICGGYQMLGRALADPHGIEGETPRMQGLGVLDIETVFGTEKTVTPWQGVCVRSGAEVTGYEIHCGQSGGEDCARPMFKSVSGVPEGACSADGRVMGAYVHGLFASDSFRAAFLEMLGAKPSLYRYGEEIETILDDWAEVLAQSLDVEKLLASAAPIRLPA